MYLVIAFLHVVGQSIYMEVPDSVVGFARKSSVFKLIKVNALYGLKQAPTRWNSKLDNCFYNL